MRPLLAVEVDKAAKEWLLACKWKIINPKSIHCKRKGIVLYSKVCGGAKSYTTITIQNMRFKR